jgi:hypothetical protein
MTIDVDLPARIKRLLASLRPPALDPFMAEWPTTNQHRAMDSTDLPVLRWLPGFARDSAAFGGDVIAALCQAAPSLAWRRTYTSKESSSAFLDNYGWTEILGRAGPWPSDKLACGFLILGPATHYPRHRHPAEEMYLPLSGKAAWQQGDSPWQERPPGTPIFHATEEPHAMRTDAQPLLALYLWRGLHLDQKARLDAGAGE